MSFFHIFLTPPVAPLVLLLLGSWILRRKRPWQRRWQAFTCALLYVFSINAVGVPLLKLYEQAPAWTAGVGSPQAIVVLGGGTYFNAPEYGGDTVSAPALERLRYAAWLSRQTGLPILVTGGAPLGNADPEGRQMQRTLEQEFRVPVRWVEDKAANTLENARLSAAILRPLEIQRVLVVSHAWHMPRAQWCFDRAGLTMVPAPTSYTTHYRFSWLDFLPSSSGLEHNRLAFHETIGMLWYRVKMLRQPT